MPEPTCDCPTRYPFDYDAWCDACHLEWELWMELQHLPDDDLPLDDWLADLDPDPCFLLTV